MEALKAAVSGGCDAVYAGLTCFSARAYSKNFDGDDMLNALEYCHLHDCRLYLTLNTLVNDEELAGVEGVLRPLVHGGLDGVIVQDLGVVRTVHELFPELPIHASTQMTITMAEGAKALEGYGVTRIVPARELSLEEIKRMKKNTELELECFVHGALCYSYSGQCMFSSFRGDRSGNRGRCAQPCRRIYSACGKTDHLLSTADLCTLEILPELVRAGVDSFKIEGRMKNKEYCAYTAHAYKTAVELMDEPEDIYRKEIRRLKDDLLELYNRGGFTTGYYGCHNSASMMSVERPSHCGTLVGKVVSSVPGSVVIEFEKDVRDGDVLEIRGHHGPVYEFTVGQGLEREGKRARTRVYKGLKPEVGLPVFRTKNKTLYDRIDEEYADKSGKIKITGRFTARSGEKIVLELERRTIDGTPMRVSVYADPPLKAEKKETGEPEIREKLERLGNTDYEFDELVIETDSGLFIPASLLNNLRRDAITGLEEAVLGMYRRTPGADGTGSVCDESTESSEEVLKAVPNDLDIPEPMPGGRRTIGLTARICSHEQLEAVLEFEEIGRVLISLEDLGISSATVIANEVREAKKQAFIYLPQICRADVYDALESELEDGLSDHFDGAVIRNFEEYELAKKLIRKKDAEKKPGEASGSGHSFVFLLDHNMYVFNGKAKEFWKDRAKKDRLDIEFTAPEELSLSQMRKNKEPGSVIVYGRTVLMTSAQCIYKTTGKCRKEYRPVTVEDKYQDGKDAPHSRDVAEFRDENNRLMLVKPVCRYCMNTIYDDEILSLIDETERLRSVGAKYFRIDLTFEDKERTRAVCRAFVNASRGEGYEMPDGRYTKGHALKPVL